MAIRLYWSGGDRHEINFGDTISPTIVQNLSGKDVVYSNMLPVRQNPHLGQRLVRPRGLAERL
jgi:hypothetical protein